MIHTARKMVRSVRLWAIVFAISAPIFVSQSCGSKDMLDPPMIPAVADFEADVTTGIAPLTVQFTDKSSGNPGSYLWAFGDDSTSTEKNPLHVYEGPGTYSVSLVCKNSQGFVDTLTKADYIEVDNCAVVDFTAMPATGDKPHTVTFTNLSQPSTADFLWRFGDGGTSTERNPTHRYNSCGTFDVALDVTATCGTRSLTKNDIVSVTAPTNLIQLNIPEIGPLWPTKIEGDCEFSGNGPDVTTSAELVMDYYSRHLYVRIKMRARETRSNWSTAEGSWTYHVYSAPTGWTISRILVDTMCETYYRDFDHSYKIQNCTWATFKSKGDTNGDDICNDTMDDTHVIVTFKTISIEITEDC